MKKIMIMGLGDVLKGDKGAGCAVLEKMAETVSGKDVDFAYLGCDTRFAAGYLLGVDLAVITGALNLSGMPGALHVWDQAVFDRNLEWMAECFPEIRGLAMAMAQAKLAGGFPGRLVFIWITPLLTETYGISNLVQGAVTKAVWQIHREIWHTRLSQAPSPCPAETRPRNLKNMGMKSKHMKFQKKPGN